MEEITKSIVEFTNINLGNLRVIQDDSGNPWFCLVDVCKPLGLDQPSRVASRLDLDGVTTIKGVSLTTNQWGTTTEQVVNLNFINEANLYKIIFTSRKREAKVFQDWVFKEVLPSIRKTGAYVEPDLTRYYLEHPEKSPEFFQEQLEMRDKEIANLRNSYGELQGKYKSSERGRKWNNTRFHNTRANLIKTELELNQKNQKVDYYNQFMANYHNKTSTELAQVFGISSAFQLNKILKSLGLVVEVNGVNVLRSDLVDLGYARFLNTPSGYPELYWTFEGEKFIYSKLKEARVL